MTEMTNNGLPVGSEDIPGTTYWGCESKFHKICIEADQRPNQRPWSAVMDYVGANPEEAAMFALVRQGSLKLTPLAIVCQEAPLDIVHAILDIAPDAVRIPDRYGCLPIHRTALQNRLDHAVAVIELLRDADPTTLLVQDGWRRTPLICSLESGRGVPSPEVVDCLLGDEYEATKMENKAGKTPLEIISERTDKVEEGNRRLIVERLSACSA